MQLRSTNPERSTARTRDLSRIILTSSYTRKREGSSFNNPHAIYMEPYRVDYALCGLELQGRSGDDAVSTCLHVEIGDKIFNDKIVLVPRSCEIPKRPLYGILACLESQVNFKVLLQWVNNCSLSHTNRCASKPVGVDDPLFKGRQRLIDVRSRWVVPGVLARMKYAALTYAWGTTSLPEAVSNQGEKRSLGSGPLRKERSQDETSVTLQNPRAQTFEDAITVCSRLDIAYLWIYQFCTD
jgi:hypothetical protein